MPAGHGCQYLVRIAAIVPGYPIIAVDDVSLFLNTDRTRTNPATRKVVIISQRTLTYIVNKENINSFPDCR